jgi:hypothetical protein
VFSRSGKQINKKGFKAAVKGIRMSHSPFPTNPQKDLRNPINSSPEKSSLLSIDVDAHLQKVAANTYRSAAHYPVELVRCAVKRGASQIHIEINKKRLEIIDNGSGINSTQMKNLNTLLETSQSFKKREQSILDLQNHQGIGLLAIFSPSPAQILIQNRTHSEQVQFLYQNGRLQKTAMSQKPTKPTGSPIGTRIVLTRKTSDLQLEKLILQKYCKFADTKIILNGQLISQKSSLTNSLVSIRLKQKDKSPPGRIGIPKQGDVCRIWLLDQGILLTRKTFAPWKGFIFEAMVEYSGEITGQFLSALQDDVNKLYIYMITHYKKIPLKYQPRIEELIFKHHRLTHNADLVNHFYPFRAGGSSSYLSLPQLQKKAEKGILFATLDKGKSPLKSGNNPDVLILNPVQMDYLVSYIRLPLRILQPAVFRINPVNQLKSAIFKLTKRIFRKNRINEKKIIPYTELSETEKLFINELFNHISGDNDPELKRYSRPVMIKSKGFFPVVATKESSIISRVLPVRIILRRNHWLVKKAVKVVFSQPENIKWIAPLFIE